MKKTIIAFMALMMLAGQLLAAHVTEATAQRVAVYFWNTYRPQDVKPVTTLQTLSFPELQHLYVFANGETDGFVIVASDDCVRPVVGYSFENPFPARLHPELRYWLSGYEEQIAYAAAVGGAADPRWGTMLDSDVPPQPVSLSQVTPLCLTTWDQGYPYNTMCPYDSVFGERAVVGCVATAMAQIMKRWNHPSCGTGSHSYVHQGMGGPSSSYGVLSADFEHTTYMWENMPNRVSVATTDMATAALSTLSYHCGVAVDMMYGTHATGGSGAYTNCGWWASACAEHAFYEYFKYDSSLEFHNRHEFSDSVWLAMIDEELASGRPLYYAGSDSTGGHAFVLDGSNYDTTYHFNWGWSGAGDGFYAMNNLAPRIGGSGGNATYTFNSGQEAIFGIQPVPEVFDTIELYDTICTNYTTYENHGYSLQVRNQTAYLRYLDTIFHLHLQVMPTNVVSYSSNIGITSDVEEYQYCAVDSIEMIECPFTRNNYHFIGWSTMKNGTPDTLYQPGNRIHMHSNVTFFARWERNSSVGVSDVEDDVVSLWPNPTTGEVVVSLGVGHYAEILVIDASGRTILREDYPNSMGGEAKISLSDLPDGAYTVQVRTSVGVYNRRIIKQK